jgi:hypothetical protein
MRRQIFAIFFSLAVLGSCVQSSAAAIVDLVWTGVTAFGGSDNLGLFGPPGAMPADTPYTAKYRFDTTTSFFENGTNGSQEVTGGTFYDPDRPAPLISASITVNGAEVAYNGNYASSYFRQTGQGSSQISALAQRELSNPQPYGGELFQRVFRTGNFYGAMQLDQPGEFDFTASDNPGGNFAYLNRDGAGNLTGSSEFQLIPSHLSITVVPEPGAWAQALVGVGLFFRRRAMTKR